MGSHEALIRSLQRFVDLTEALRKADGLDAERAVIAELSTTADNARALLAFAPIRDEWLTPAEVADELNVSPTTVRRWIRTEELNAYRFGTGRPQQRITRSDLDAFTAKRGTSETD
jgi:excisionase family DNA binding protein